MAPAEETSTDYPVVGRERELSQFAAVLRDDDLHAFAVHGPAGVGKSRLAEECLAMAGQAGFQCGRAIARPSLNAVPLGALAHLLPAGTGLDPVGDFTRVVETLTQPAEGRWVLMVDDLHWLDAASAVLLRQLLDAGAVKLVVTIRSGEPVGHAVATLCGGDAVRRVDLAEFDHDGVARFLRAALGGPVSERAVRGMHRHSGGNALYLRELLHGGVASGALTHDGQLWDIPQAAPAATPQLAELVRARLAGTGDDARTALELLALCEPVSLADVQAVASLETLTGLERSGIVRTGTDGRRLFLALAHPLYGEVLRGEMPAERRTTLMLAQAGRVEAFGARRREDELRVAGWRLDATGTADPDLLRRAAVLARHANDYRQIVQLTAALPPAERTLPIKVLRAEGLLEAGRWKEGEEILSEAYAHTATDEERLQIAYMRVINLLWIAAQPETALQVVREAEARIRGPVGRRLLRIIEGTVLAVSGEPGRAAGLLAELERDPEHLRAMNANAWLMGAWALPVALAQLGRSQEAVASAKRHHAVHLQVSAHSPVTPPAHQLIALVLALTEAGETARAVEAGAHGFEEMMGAARQDGPGRSGRPAVWRCGAVWMATFLGRTFLLTGRPASARRWFSEAAAVARAHGHMKSLHRVYTGLAAAAAQLGELDAAQSALEEAWLHPRSGLITGEDALGTAWHLAALGNLAEARELLLKAAGQARAAGHVNAEAWLLTDIARLGGAREVVRRLEELAHVGDGKLIWVRVRFVRALASRDPDDLVLVAAGAEAVGADLWAAEAVSAAAGEWRRRGEERRANAALQQAAGLLSRCEGSRTPLLVVAPRATPLTARQAEIATMAVSGHSSMEIARALFLSVRTVENHLNQVYAKLGVAGRPALAEALRND
uniref:AAA family ATPase n=1 Tax=Herbidospora sakaeratensis TaxID=564415 RepID=UPI000784FB1C|nr:LuxR family transcriptional regulator [Herbidospora sakaeratensis]